MELAMKKSLLLTLFFLLGLAPFVANADAENGMKLHDGNCISCHASRYGNDGTEIYTRPNHRMKDLAGLKKQVNFCKNNLGLTWFDDEVDDVTEYLNKTFYQFKK
jgi:mono/diheme cytochrome c family protein